MPALYRVIGSHWLFLAAQLVHKANARWCEVAREFQPLDQADVPFVAEWRFEANAGDVDRMIVRRSG